MNTATPQVDLGHSRFSPKRSADVVINSVITNVILQNVLVLSVLLVLVIIVSPEVRTS